MSIPEQQHNHGGQRPAHPVHGALAGEQFLEYLSVVMLFADLCRFSVNVYGD